MLTSTNPCLAGGVCPAQRLEFPNIVFAIAGSLWMWLKMLENKKESRMSAAKLMRVYRVLRQGFRDSCGGVTQVAIRSRISGSLNPVIRLCRTVRGTTAPQRMHYVMLTDLASSPADQDSLANPMHPKSVLQTKCLRPFRSTQKPTRSVSITVKHRTSCGFCCLLQCLRPS